MCDTDLSFEICITLKYTKYNITIIMRKYNTKINTSTAGKVRFKVTFKVTFEVTLKVTITHTHKSTFSCLNP